MQKQKRILSFIGIIIITVALIILFCGFFAYHYFFSKKTGSSQITCTLEAKICPDGSAVGRTGQNCEFAECPNATTYTNEEYGFSITFPNSWKGYSIEKTLWQGSLIDDYSQKYNGTKLVFKNPQSTIKQHWQDIPIMVFTEDIWKLIEEEKIAVSAAPIGPNKIGENQKYIFATPPRWVGFTDDLGGQEAEEIVKTFKAFETN